MVEITNLEIVGYADTLTEELVPRIVPPIYRVCRTENVIFPPFKFEGTRLAGDMADMRKFEREVQRGEATKLPSPIPAKPNCELWVDTRFNVIYEPCDAAVTKLRNIAKENIRHARKAIDAGNFKDALLLAQQALSADERNVNAILVKALIFRADGDKTQVEGFRRIAHVTHPDLDFDYELEVLSNRISSPIELRTNNGCLSTDNLSKYLKCLYAIPESKRSLEPCGAGI